MRIQFSDAKDSALQNSVFRIKVTLLSGMITQEYLDNNPTPPSRTIDILGSQTLYALHKKIFEAFDRYDEHMFEFQIGGKRPMAKNCKHYGLVMDDMFSDFFPDTPKVEDVHDTDIASLELKVKKIFFYWFDFGDDWWHELEVLAITPLEGSKKRYPKVVERVGESPEQYPNFEDEDYDDDDDEEEEFLEINEEEIVQLPRFQEIFALIEDFFQKHPNDDSFELAKKILLSVFAVELNVERGKAQSWAAGIIRMIEPVDALEQSENAVQLTPKEIAKHFGVAVSTMDNKSRLIKATVSMVPIDPLFGIPENLRNNFLKNLMITTEMLKEIEKLSPEEQEEAYEKKLRPFMKEKFPDFKD